MKLNDYDGLCFVSNARLYLVIPVTKDLHKLLESNPEIAVTVPTKDIVEALRDS